MEVNPFPNRPLPADHSMEQAVLTTVFLYPDLIPDIFSILEPQDFFSHEHTLIFKAMKAIHGQGGAVNRFTVAHELERHDIPIFADEERMTELVEAKGTTYLTELAVNNFISDVRADWYATVVKSMSNLRQIMEVGSRLQIMAATGEPEDWQAIVDKGSGELLNVGGNGSRRVSRNAHEIMYEDGLDEEIEAYLANPRLITGYRTGLGQLDRHINGWRKGAVHLFAAASSLGKSLFTQDMATRLVTADEPKHVLIFSTEMSRQEVESRMVFQLAGYDPQTGRNRGFVTDEEAANVRAAKVAIARAPLRIVEAAGMNPGHIRTELQRWQIRGQCDLAIVDHLDDLIETGRHGRAAEVRDVCRELKQTARYLDIPILEVSQLNRGNLDINGQHKGSYTDRLLDGSAKNQCADTTAFLIPWNDEDHCEIPEDRAKEMMGRLQLLNMKFLLTKARGGTTGSWPMTLSWKQGGKFLERAYVA